MYGGPSSPMKYCQLWFADHESPIVSAAEYNIVPETHDRKYVLSLCEYVCGVMYSTCIF